MYMCPLRDECVSPLQDQCHSGRRGEAKAAFTPLLASVLKFMTCRTSTTCHRSHSAGWEFSRRHAGCHRWRLWRTLLHYESFRSFKFLIPCTVVLFIRLPPLKSSFLEGQGYFTIPAFWASVRTTVDSLNRDLFIFPSHSHTNKCLWTPFLMSMWTWRSDLVRILHATSLLVIFPPVPVAGGAVGRLFCSALPGASSHPVPAVSSEIHSCQVRLL